MLTAFRIGLFFLGGICVLATVIGVAIRTGSLRTALDSFMEER